MNARSKLWLSLLRCTGLHSPLCVCVCGYELVMKAEERKRERVSEREREGGGRSMRGRDRGSIIYLKVTLICRYIHLFAL